MSSVSPFPDSFEHIPEPTSRSAGVGAGEKSPEIKESQEDVKLKMGFLFKPEHDRPAEFNEFLNLLDTAKTNIPQNTENHALMTVLIDILKQNQAKFLGRLQEGVFTGDIQPPDFSTELSFLRFLLDPQDK